MDQEAEDKSATKSACTQEKTTEDFSSAWDNSAATSGGDDLWAFPTDNDNDYSNYSTEGGFDAAFEGVGFDDAVFEEDKVISFQDTGNSLLTGEILLITLRFRLAACTN